MDLRGFSLQAGLVFWLVYLQAIVWQHWNDVLELVCLKVLNVLRKPIVLPHFKLFNMVGVLSLGDLDSIEFSQWTTEDVF